ncbi:MAG: replication initiation protein, partial [Candidatus Marinimicrobia bacterium]|nr:replication initiation protein [Candidatus Neomarinimicrobiota bacterium]
LAIDFTQEFVKELIGIEKFFMEVGLNYLFKLSGRKSKLLYLILKDYSKIKNKNFTKSQLELLIGRVYQKRVVDKIVEQINDVTDVKVRYKVEGVKKKKYIFKINQKANDGSAKGKAKTKKSIDAEVMEGAKKKLQRKKDKGERVYNEEGFLRTIYDNDMEKLKPSEEQIEIDSIVDSLKSEYDLSEYSDEKIPILVFYVTGSNMPFYIDSEYRLVDMNGVERNINSPKSLHEFIDWANNGKLKFRVWKNDGYSKPFEKSCLLSNDELRRRGLVL